MTLAEVYPRFKCGEKEIYRESKPNAVYVCIREKFIYKYNPNNLIEPRTHVSRFNEHDILYAKDWKFFK